MCLVATEDKLSVSVALKLLECTAINLDSLIVLPTSGNGYLKIRLDNFCEAARNGQRVFILTDLDKISCPPMLLTKWFSNTKWVVEQASLKRLLFRVVVREIEAWIMADREGFAQLLGISCNKIQRNIEDIGDPKNYLFKLAKIANRNVRQELLIEKRGVASRGPGYDELLTYFVSNHWCPVRASENSPSLKKAIIRIEAWASDISTQKAH
jgi:hypothetical protein